MSHLGHWKQQWQQKESQVPLKTIVCFSNRPTGGCGKNRKVYNKIIYDYILPMLIASL
jgi:hypothetical protein